MNLIERNSAIERVVNYFLNQVRNGDSRPPKIVLDLLHLKWPGRCFLVSADADYDEPITLVDVVINGETTNVERFYDKRHPELVQTDLEDERTDLEDESQDDCEVACHSGGDC